MFFREYNIKTNFVQCWDEYHNPSVKVSPCFHKSDPNNFSISYFRYKLHISMDPKFFMEVEEDINLLLMFALNAKIIPRYKVLNFAGVKKSGEDASRQMQIPFVIYLYNKYDEVNFQKVIELLQAIEKVLQKYKVKQGDHKLLEASDISLGYFVFCQTDLSVKAPREYISAEDARAPKLRAAGLKTKQYQALAKVFAVKDMKIESAAQVKKPPAQQLPSPLAVNDKFMMFPAAQPKVAAQDTPTVPAATLT